MDSSLMIYYSTECFFLLDRFDGRVFYFLFQGVTLNSLFDDGLLYQLQQQNNRQKILEDVWGGGA